MAAPRWSLCSLTLAVAACGGEVSTSQDPVGPVPLEIPAAPIAPSSPSPPPIARFPSTFGALDVRYPPKTETVRTDGGVISYIFREGAGYPPSLEDRVTVHYVGWDRSGEEFDSSYKRESPATFSVSGVIEGWTQALLQMREGEQRRVWIPAELAYGHNPKRGGAPRGDLIFDIELITIKRSEQAPETPVDVAAPPASATVLPSGLTYRVLNAGPGGSHPKKSDTVTVHYSGWTTDGKMFDSSVTRGDPARFVLTGVIPGFAEGIQQMAVGDSIRVWIPEALAYQGKQGRPQGMLVFDIALLEIE